MGENQLAVNAIKKSLKIDKKLFQSYYSLGIIYTDMFNFEKAVNSYTTAIELDSTSSAAHNNLANLFSNMDNKEAEYHYKKTIELHIAHNDGCYYVNQDEIKKLEDKNQIALEYSDINGNVSDKTNPNGSLNNIAGIYNEKQNILGMMPHPERMIDPLLGGEDGSLFFKDLISNN